MDRIKKNFGFGCMRLPMKGEEVDIEQFTEMVDCFIANGFNYFDTAHPYINGLSEKAIKVALTSRYSRDKYLLTNKLTAPYFNKQEDIRPFFESQLELCGVDYFDFYLMHAQSSRNYDKFVACNAYQTAFELKKEGKIRHVGLSFHDTPEFLDKILTENPEIEIVQIQLNYLDWENPGVQSRGVYEVCEKHGKPVIVMEPVKGGALVNLPEESQVYLDELKGGSNASYAIRYAASLPMVKMVLSGMSDLPQMEDNVSFMKEFKPLSEKEYQAIDKVVESYKKKKSIACTACRYCIEENHCPKDIQIPNCFAAYNAKMVFRDWRAGEQYEAAILNHGAADSCIKCGKCERVCPQHLPIRELLKSVAEEFKK